MKINSPWPATDREMVMKFQLLKVSEKHFRVNNEALQDYIPKEEDYLRVPYLKSTTDIYVINNNRVDVVFFMELNPGGNVPVWLINMASTGGPVETFQNVQRILTEESKK